MVLKQTTKLLLVNNWNTNKEILKTTSGVNEETRAHTAWLACDPVGLVAVPQQSLEGQQGSVHRFDNFENFSRLTSKIVVKLAFPRLQVDTSAIAGLIE